MTPAQNRMYWACWNAAKAKRPDLDRHALQFATIGRHCSSKDLKTTSAPGKTSEFDDVIGAFNGEAKPHDVNAQLRQLQQPETRIKTTIARQQMCLSLLLSHPTSYFLTILDQRFHTTDLDSLDGRSLVHLRNTLAARLSGLRKKGILGDGKPLTEHQMCQLAQVPCFRANCAQCHPTNRRRRGNESQINSHPSAIASTAGCDPF